MTNPAGLDDSGVSPEAQRALAEARSRPITFPRSPDQCLHLQEDGVVEVGRGFNDDRHVTTVHRCLECGTEFVTEEQQ